MAADSVLVPIPSTPEYLAPTEWVWLPYLQAIAARSRNDLSEMVRSLYAGETQAVIAWNPERKTPQAFLGVRYARRGADLVGELIWLTGTDRAAWVNLIGDLEAYLREHQGCKTVKSINRPGWTKPLKEHGYRLTHQIMEKELTS